MDLESLNEKMVELSLETSCLESSSFLEANNTCSVSCLENCWDCNVDSQSLKFVGRFFCSASHFESCEVTESSSPDQTEDQDMVFVCQTPSEVIFDPFAPGPNDLGNAPKKKTMKGSGVCFRRQLHFDSGSDSEEELDTDELDNLDEEKTFLSWVFDSLLKLIVSAQLAEISIHNQVADSGQSEDCKTPISSPLLTGIAETCPPAPQKPALTLKRLDHSICRKLDFESYLN